MDHEGRMARDEEFARWYRTYHPRIRALCTRILRDAAAAEDVAQEALLRAWTKHEEMREEDLGAWLSVVARNLCVSMVRRDGRLVVTDDLPEKADFGSDPAMEAGRRESRRNVRRALAKLGDRHRRVIYLSEVREVDYAEIGEELGLTAEGARSIAFRARRVLRDHLAAVGEGFTGVLVGVRVRFRELRLRTRDFARSGEAGSVPLMQAGLNLALALGVTIAGAAGFGQLSGNPARSGGPFAAAHRAVAAPQLEAPPSLDGNAAAPSTEAGDPRKAPKLLQKPTVDGPIYDDNGGHDIDIDVHGHHVGVSGHREEDDGLGAAYWAMDSAVGAACGQQPQICEALDGD